MAISVRPLGPALGAALDGVDLSKPIDEETASAIRNAFAEHYLLLLPAQTIDNADHLRFGALFGDVQEERTKPELAIEHPGIMYVSNARADGILPDGEMWFHADQCYFPTPVRATCLYAIEVPSVGGNTIFVNTVAAYEALPADMKARLEGRTAVNEFDYARNATRRTMESSPDAPRAAQPVVCRDPRTGERHLFVNRLMTTHLNDMDPGESDGILNALFDHLEQERFRYEHVWTPGDLMIWDNRKTLHARTDFDPEERRVLRRITIEGEAMVA